MMYHNPSQTTKLSIQRPPAENTLIWTIIMMLLCVQQQSLVLVLRNCFSSSVLPQLEHTSEDKHILGLDMFPKNFTISKMNPFQISITFRKK
mmetsp:Transcript_22479/g.29403  ORF Transcript_22479/g.29403 Transcript_22479/m.29403 type:complete len:92 (-) Transcript_22479:1591-1866(-)